MYSKVAKVVVPVVACIAIALSFFLLNKNVDSLYDEGYLFQCLTSAGNGHVGGMSQWVNLLQSILGENICSSILSLRFVRLLLTLLTIILFWLITSRPLCSTFKERILYLCFVFLLAIPSLDGIILSYNGISQFCLVVGFGALFVLMMKQSKIDYFYSAIIGSLGMMAAFSILPSALLFLICAFVLIVVTHSKYGAKHLLFMVCSFLLGVIIVLLFFHYFVADLSTVLGAMSKTAESVTKLNRGYDPISFITKYLLFFRDLLFCLVFVLGAFYVREKLLGNRGWWGIVCFAALVLLFVFYLHYQTKPRVTVCMIAYSILVASSFIQFFEHSEKPSRRFLVCSSIYFFLFPFVAVLGTNVYLGSKMCYFVIPLAALFWLNWKRGQKSSYVLECSIFLALSILPSQTIDLVGSMQDDNALRTVPSGPLCGMVLNANQEAHFAKVSDILNDYSFTPNKSVVFCTQLSSMTVCYLGAVACGNFFQPMDFTEYKQKEKLPIPDFLFLCDYDVDIAGYELKQMPWGWPEEFDAYEVGSPDQEGMAPYPVSRTLYCRKELYREKDQ